MRRILSLGAGVQSTTLALMSAVGELEPLDGAIFADTLWEPAEVYAHLDRLERLVPFPIHRVSAGDLRADVLARRNTTGGRYGAIPWYTTNADGSAGMGRRQCTSEYKLTPIVRKLRDLLGPTDGRRRPAGAVEQWIGISVDEASRMKPARQRYITNRWPLIERYLSRADCLRWLAAHGYDAPPRSACIGCPFHNGAAWRAMARDRPAEFTHACEVDAALRVDRDRLEYMHPSRRPLAEAVAASDPDRDNLNLFDNECTGHCGV